MTFEQRAAKPRVKASWLLWWRTDSAEIDRQVRGYRTLGVFKSSRGVAALCLGFSGVITGALVMVGTQPSTGLIDVILMGGLAGFVYFGHRWAMIAAMILWSLEKALIALGGIGSQSANGAIAVGQVIWWCIYMHAFLMAFKVEQSRRQKADLEVFS